MYTFVLLFYMFVFTYYNWIYKTQDNFNIDLKYRSSGPSFSTVFFFDIVYTSKNWKVNN